MRKTFLAALVGLAVLTAALFGRAVHFQFVNYDDDVILLKNRVVQTFDVKAMFTREVAGDYIPLTLLTYAAEFKGFGLDPSIYHFDNIVLHFLDCVLLVFLLYELTAHDVFLTSAAAAFFAVHPLHVQSVAWVTERKDVLCTLFYLISFLCFVEWSKAGPRRRTFYGLSFVAFVAALLAKAMAVTLPVALLVADVTVLPRAKKLKWLVLEKIPFFLASAAVMVLHLFIHDTNKLVAAPDFTWFTPLARAGESLTFYLSRSLVPAHLSAFYKQGVEHTPLWAYGTALAVTVAAVVFVLNKTVASRSRRFVVFGALFFLISIAPVLQAIPYGNHFAYADHYFYIPGIGLALIYAVFVKTMAAGAGRLRPWAGRGVVAAGILFLTVLAVESYARVGVWRTSETLWKDAIAKNPANPVAYFNLGGYYTFDSGRPAEALPVYDKELSLTPDDPLAYFNRGMALNKLGRTRESIADFQTALKLAPGVRQIYFNLALLYALQNHFPDAEKILAAYTDAHPEDAQGHVQLGKLYMKEGKLDEASHEYGVAERLKLGPDDGL